MHTDYSAKKTLKSYTIVPQGLYVVRQADRQLKEIIIDKGRPGYVLVSRQMGKTNLLLNARRESQSTSNHFVYLDISNNFPDLSSFFRNIIDVAIDSLFTNDSLVKKTIDKMRLEGLYSNYPHKEHEQELRYILSETQGDIIICLDEVDSIIKTNYSNSVFSFIRSVYFSGRVNFPIFQRLTYVLSGVAEPSELIKDKGSSPFNIGEKIYLDDFTFEEFKQLILNAKLIISEESQNRIFYWTNGNPRLTWDICSKIEDFILLNESITPSNVDEIVNANYLSAFDLPPIDHIRVLAEEDAEVRTCLIAMHYGKGSTLTDQQKSKLYLSGIIGSSINNEAPRIKNRIIAEALSEAWLKEIDNSKLTILERANKFYESKQLADAILLYEEYVSTIADETIIDPITFHKIGSSYYELSRFDEAVLFLSKKPFTEESLDLFLIQNYWRGMCCFFIGDLKQSQTLFQIVIDKSKEFKSYKYYYDACVNLTSALIKEENYSYEYILSILDDVLHTPEKSIIAQSQKNIANIHNLTSVANINLFKASHNSGLNDLALGYVTQAINYADSQSKVGLIIELLESKLSTKLESEILDEAMSYIYEHKLSILRESIKYPNAFDSDKAVKLIAHAYRLGDLSKTKDFIDYLISTQDRHEVPVVDILFVTCGEFLAKGRMSDYFDLTKVLFKLPREMTLSAQLKLLLGVRILFDDKDLRVITKFDIAYVNEFWVAEAVFEDEEMVDIDYKILEVLTTKYRLTRKFREGIELINKFKAFKANDLVIVYDNPLSVTKNIIVLYREIILSIPLLGPEIILSMLVRLNELFKLNYSNELIYYNKQSIDELKAVTNRLIHDFSKSKTVRNEGLKYGRNQVVSVKFKDGKVAKGKYKNLKDKIDSGECSVIND